MQATTVKEKLNSVSCIAIGEQSLKPFKFVLLFHIKYSLIGNNEALSFEKYILISSWSNRHASQEVLVAKPLFSYGMARLVCAPLLHHVSCLSRS